MTDSIHFKPGDTVTFTNLRIELDPAIAAFLRTWFSHKEVRAIRNCAEQGIDYDPQRDDPLALSAAAKLELLLPPE
jgi:hypothetical protein